MAATHSIDGFYTAYLTGVAGNSIAIFMFRDGVVVGADAGGGIYDGIYGPSGNKKTVAAKIKFLLPVGNSSITGVTADKQPISVEMTLELPTDVSRDDVHLLQTPLGPVNAKLEKIRGT